MEPDLSGKTTTGLHVRARIAAAYKGADQKCAPPCRRRGREARRGEEG